MAFNTNITPGRPPLLWSDVHEAFTQVNENFDILVATIGGGSGLTPLNFETLDTSLKPATSNTYQLGDSLYRWKSVHTSEWSNIAGSELNGLWAGSAQIKGVGLTVNLPENSTIGGDPATGIGVSLIIDPDKTFFKTAQVDNAESVVACDFADTLNLNSGTAIQLVVDSSAESITFNNTGVTSLIAGQGISVNTATGNITVTNTGVRSLTSTTALPSGRTVGDGINIDNSTGDGIKITNTGVLGVQAGFGISVSTDTASGIAQVSFNPTTAPSAAFTAFHIDGDVSANDIVADSISDTFTFVEGYGIILSSDPVTDKLTITVNQNIDIIGSVFGDDSTKLVDAIENKIVGNIETNSLRTSETKLALGSLAGETNQGVNGIAIGPLSGQTSQGVQSIAIGANSGNTSQGLQAVAIGNLAGSLNQGQRAVALGSLAGATNQGDYAVALGNFAGGANQPANSIVINASGLALNGSAAGFFVDPVRNQSGASGVVQYDSTTKEVSYSSALGSVSGTFTGNIFTSLIDSADSSAITVTPATIFSSDVTVENDLIVAEQLTVKGSRVINLTELKSVVADSASFADFQTRIAALV
jgi:hypothetical protein